MDRCEICECTKPLSTSPAAVNLEAAVGAVLKDMMEAEVVVHTEETAQDNPAKYRQGIAITGGIWAALGDDGSSESENESESESESESGDDDEEERLFITSMLPVDEDEPGPKRPRPPLAERRNEAPAASA
jgi:hypothetical protein